MEKFWLIHIYIFLESNFLYKKSGAEEDVWIPRYKASKISSCNYNCKDTRIKKKNTMNRDRGGGAGLQARKGPLKSCVHHFSAVWDEVCWGILLKLFSHLWNGELGKCLPLVLWGGFGASVQMGPLEFGSRHLQCGQILIYLWINISGSKVGRCR